MNITQLTNSQITLLEIYQNNYKQFRLNTAKPPKHSRAQKSQKQKVMQFNHWLHNTLKPKQQMFLLAHGIIDVMAEVNRFIDTNYPTTKKISHELQVL